MDINKGLGYLAIAAIAIVAIIVTQKFDGTMLKFIIGSILLVSLLGD